MTFHAATENVFSFSASSPVLDNDWMEEEINRLTLENVAMRHLMESMARVTEAGREPPENAALLDMLSSMLNDALISINARDGALLVVDADAEELVFTVTQGRVGPGLAWRRIPLDTGVAGWVAQQRQAVIVNDPRSDARFSVEMDQHLDFETNSILAVPIIREGELIGVMEAVNQSDEDGFCDDDLQMFGYSSAFIGTLLGVIIDRTKQKVEARRTPARSDTEEVASKPKQASVPKKPVARKKAAAKKKSVAKKKPATKKKCAKNKPTAKKSAAGSTKATEIKRTAKTLTPRAGARKARVDLDPVAMQRKVFPDRAAARPASERA